MNLTEPLLIEAMQAAWNEIEQELSEHPFGFEIIDFGNTIEADFARSNFPKRVLAKLQAKATEIPTPPGTGEVAALDPLQPFVKSLEKVKEGE